jgi:hypothetical protein
MDRISGRPYAQINEGLQCGSVNRTNRSSAGTLKCAECLSQIRKIIYLLEGFNIIISVPWVLIEPESTFVSMLATVLLIKSLLLQFLQDVHR